MLKVLFMFFVAGPVAAFAQMPVCHVGYREEPKKDDQRGYCPEPRSTESREMSWNAKIPSDAREWTTEQRVIAFHKLVAEFESASANK